MKIKSIQFSDQNVVNGKSIVSQNICHVFFHNKRFMFQIMFLIMLVMYSAFVLTSVGTEYYIKDIARAFEYYVYFWGAGDFIEELISCLVSVKTVFVYYF